MAFRLEIWDHVSITGLLCAARERHWVVHRTSHLGNQYPSNLFLLEAGIPAVLFDRNVAGKDRNYWPERLIVGGESYPISDYQDRKRPLTPQGQISPLLTWNENRPRTEEFGLAATPAGLHLQSLMRLYPTLVETESAHLLRHRALLEPVFSAIASALPNEFDRVVDEQGRVSSRVASWEGSLVDGVFKTCETIVKTLAGETISMQRLLLHSNPLAMYTMLWAATRSAGVTTLVDCSGPDMVRYVRTIEPRLRLIHEVVCTATGNNDDLTLAIVPTASLVFTSTGPKEPLREFLDCWQERRERTQEMRTMFRAKARECPDIGADHRLAQNRLNQRMRELVPHCELGYNIRHPSFWTQYDLLRTNTRPSVHPLMLTTPVSEIQAKGRKLRVVS